MSLSIKMVVTCDKCAKTLEVELPQDVTGLSNALRLLREKMQADGWVPVMRPRLKSLEFCSTTCAKEAIP